MGVVKIDIKIYRYSIKRSFKLYHHQHQHTTMHTPHQQQLHTSSISTTTIEDDDLDTPKAPRGRRSDITETDLQEFTRSFSYGMAMAGYIEE